MEDERWGWTLDARLQGGQALTQAGTAHGWGCSSRLQALNRLIETIDDEIIKPAEAKFKQLLARRVERIDDRIV